MKLAKIDRCTGRFFLYKSLNQAPIAASRLTSIYMHVCDPLSARLLIRPLYRTREYLALGCYRWVLARAYFEFLPIQTTSPVMPSWLSLFRTSGASVAGSSGSRGSGGGKQPKRTASAGSPEQSKDVYVRCIHCHR